MELLLSQSPSAFFSSGAGGVVLAFIFWSDFKASFFLMWGSIYAATALVRLVVAKMFHRSPPAQRGNNKWFYYYAACVFASGLVWGLFLLALLQVPGQFKTIAVTATFAAILASALAAYSASLFVYIAYAIALLSPVVIYIANDPSSSDKLMIALILIWLLYLISSARRFSDFVIRSLGFEYQNTELLQQLEEENKRAEILASELLVLSNTDALTDVYNRRYFDERIIKEWHRAGRNHHSMSLLMCDIDNFKSYNDTYGHLKGDECITKVAETIKHALRDGNDFVARYGGEEFAVVLYNSDLESAAQLARRLKNEVQELKIEHSGSECAKHVTLSIGVSSVYPGESSDLGALIETADDALYQAKRSGRNQVALMPDTGNLH